jgi:DNA-binding response OmpR family regulator
MLPKINGFELLRQIRADGRLKALPVIILTAKGQTRDRETAAALGADLFLTKPFANKDVVAAVKTLAGG